MKKSIQRPLSLVFEIPMPKYIAQLKLFINKGIFRYQGMKNLPTSLSFLGYGLKGSGNIIGLLSDVKLERARPYCNIMHMPTIQASLYIYFIFLLVIKRKTPSKRIRPMILSL
jgi:hypothetical protein